jgi:tetratricopeptide (TPR) repeat protein
MTFSFSEGTIEADMSELRVGSIEMPAAEIGSENPLPGFQAPRPEGEKAKFSDEIPKSERKLFVPGVGWGGPLPHRIQDGYSRQRRRKSFKTLVLENDILRATFFIEIGGRLWSLFHKPTQRELLHVNTVFQPANMAVRGAWVSGGVEWNIGIIGHTALTCSPLFAARVKGDDGQPILRLYEWDRLRGTPYQLDAYLPDGSPWLFARIRIVNPHDDEVPMYWWSNISVEERPDVRVIAPAVRAIKHDPEKGVVFIPVPVWKERDRSYATNWPESAEDYYYIEKGQRPWITALGKDGSGLLQASTRRLLGRKMFAWGMGTGGRRWTNFLAGGNRPYVEIQGGLTRTQHQYLPMPGRTEWSWLEAYGLMEADPALVHGQDWAAARGEVVRRLGRRLPQKWLESELDRTARAALRAPEEILHAGSGWGALERRRRRRAGERPFCGEELVFDDSSMGEEQAPWLALLEKGGLPSHSPETPPSAWMTQPEWRGLLEEALRAGRGDHWLSWLHLGVMSYPSRVAKSRQAAPEFAKAKEAWERSLQRAPSAWAWRNLAVAAKHEGRLAEAAEMYLTACRMRPDLFPLAAETLQALYEAGRIRDMTRLVATLPTEVQEHGRVKVLLAKAALDAGELDQVESLLRSGIELADMREGEVVLSDLWFRMQEKRLSASENIPIDDSLRERVRREFPPPPELDFRTYVEKT